MRKTSAALAVLPLVLAGCVIVPPDPTYQAVSLVGSALVSASSVVPGAASDAVVHEHGRIDNVCIQFNPAVGLDDFVPAVQRELRENRVDSRIYEQGMQPADCKALLRYSAFLDWGQRALDDRYSAYLTFASMTLSTNDGRVLASANYESSRMGLDKWSSTQSKISGVVRALLADREAEN